MDTFWCRSMLVMLVRDYNISREIVNLDCNGLVAELLAPNKSDAVVACSVILPLPLNLTLISVIQASEAQLYRAAPG